MKGPNIFDYATSELSQDAFICYLLEFGKEQYKNDFSKEYEIAHHFLEKCGIPFDEKIEEIKKQYKCRKRQLLHHRRGGLPIYFG